MLYIPPLLSHVIISHIFMLQFIFHRTRGSSLREFVEIRKRRDIIELPDSFENHLKILAVVIHG